MAVASLKRAAGTAGGGALEHSMPLWILIGLELVAMAHLRSMFRRHHGG